MIFELKFKNQNDIPRDKFLLDQLTFNGRANGYMMEEPKQSNYLKLRTEIERFKE